MYRKHIEGVQLSGLWNMVPYTKVGKCVLKHFVFRLSALYVFPLDTLYVRNILKYQLKTTW